MGEDKIKQNKKVIRNGWLQNLWHSDETNRQI